MEIDEQELNGKLRRHTRAVRSLKEDLKQKILRDVKRGKTTDLGDLCEKTGLSPKDATALYHVLYDQLPDVPAGEYNLSASKLEQLTLGPQEVERLPTGTYKLKIDPNYVFRVVMVSDTHLGSRHDNVEGLEEMFDRALAIGAKAVLHSGDVTDGLRKHRDMFLYLRGDAQTWEGQYDRVVKHWPSREGVVTYFIAGNHDHFAQEMVGVDICKHISMARGDMVYLKRSGILEAALERGLPIEVLAQVMESKDLGSGRVGAVRLGPYHLPPEQRNTILMMIHPGDGSAQTMSYKPQRIVANLDTLLHSFENMESPQGKRIKPHILQIGHYHKADVNVLRNVYVFQGGTMKLADEFHEVKNLNNMMGYWIVELSTKSNGDIVRIGYRFQEAYVPPERHTRRVVGMKTE